MHVKRLSWGNIARKRNQQHMATYRISKNLQKKVNRTNKFSKDVGYDVNIQKSIIFLYISNG